MLALSLAQCTEEGPAEPIAKALLDRLLAGGVDVNETHAGTSLLGLALYRPSWAAATSRPNEMAVVRLLLDGGADLFANADRLGEMPDGPLDAACPMSLLLYSKTFSRKFLPGIAGGLSQEQKQCLVASQKAPPGWDPVRNAAMRSDDAVVDALLQIGLDANLRAGDGLLPIHAHPLAWKNRSLLAATHLSRADSDTLLVEALLSPGGAVVPRWQVSKGLKALAGAMPSAEKGVRMLRIGALVDGNASEWQKPLPEPITLHGLRGKVSIPALVMLVACTQKGVPTDALKRAAAVALKAGDQDALDVLEALRLWHGDLSDDMGPRESGQSIDASHAARGSARMMAFLACTGLSSESAVRPAAVAPIDGDSTHGIRRAACTGALSLLPQHLHGLSAFPDSLSVRPAVISSWRRRIAYVCAAMVTAGDNLAPNEAAVLLASTCHPAEGIGDASVGAILDSSLRTFDAEKWSAFDDALARLDGTCLGGSEMAWRVALAQWDGCRTVALHAARLTGGAGQARRRRG